MTAHTEAELMHKLAENLAAVHNVHRPTRTSVDELLETKIRYEAAASQGPQVHGIRSNSGRISALLDPE